MLVADVDAAPKSNCTDVVWAAPATAALPARTLSANAGKQPLSLAIKAWLVSVDADPKVAPVDDVAVKVKPVVTFC